jgi:hypothetical protein
MDAPSGTEAKKMCEDDENDEALVQKWRGSVPTSISMHRAEVCSVVPPESYFVSIPRFARITAFHDWFENGEMREYFQHFRWVKSGGGDENAKTNRDENHDDKSSANTTTTTITTHNTVWFETKPMEVELFNLRGGKKRKISIPIQWNAPFGVIADIIKALVGSENNTVPLELVARYSQRDELSLSFRHALGDDAQKACKSHFFNALKEASYIQTGSSQVVMSMGVQVRENLWESTMTMGTVISDDGDIDSNSTGYKKAKEALTKIRKEAGKREKKMIGGGVVPIRAYEVDVARQGKEGENGDIDDTEDGQAFWERCVRFSSAPIGRNLSITECLDDVLFPHKINSSTKGESRTIQIEGIEIDESKPVGALWNTLAAPDGFMHIVVIKNYRKL